MAKQLEDFPKLQNERILKAAKGEDVDKVPVWVMRQAGRYLPEFQEVRKHHDFFEVCRTPALACEVTMQPLRRFDLDASIIFSDILVIPQAMGMKVDMVPGKGPVFPEPLNLPEDLSKLDIVRAVDRLHYVFEAITLTRKTINGKVPLIGFSGAPWTLMGYMIEGGGSETMNKARNWLTEYEHASETLLNILTDIIGDYLVHQVQAGAQMLMVFESSAEKLTKCEFKKFCIPRLRQICERVNRDLRLLKLDSVPMILFAKGAGHSLNEQSVLGYDVIGIDWSVDPELARNAVGPNITLMGNLSPQDMFKEPPVVEQLTAQMVQKFGKHRYIANLGHGILPTTPIESMKTFVDTVHNAI
uniref:Uroporphyrinogen decarboxylase n=1 Tax=Xenopsylla cheopis TaxID=163159 RepID=A0A6M2DIC9_XENCH